MVGRRARTWYLQPGFAADLGRCRDRRSVELQMRFHTGMMRQTARNKLERAVLPSAAVQVRRDTDRGCRCAVLHESELWVANREGKQDGEPQVGIRCTRPCPPCTRNAEGYRGIRSEPHPSRRHIHVISRRRAREVEKRRKKNATEAESGVVLRHVLDDVDGMTRAKAPLDWTCTLSSPRK